MDAVQWLGNNYQEIEMFCAKYVRFKPATKQLIILNPTGNVIANVGDYVVHVSKEVYDVVKQNNKEAQL